MLLTHVCIALLSLLSTTLAYLLPSRLKLYISAFLIASTLATGTLLVMNTNGHLLQACVSGLAYLSLVTLGMAAAWRRLVAQEN